MKNQIKQPLPGAEKLSKFLSNSTHSEFADQIGISRAYLSQILSSARRPGLDVIAKIELETRNEVVAADWVRKERERRAKAAS